MKLKFYENLTLVGSGWWGKVYSGYDRQHRRKVAIKVLDDIEKAKHEVSIMQYRPSVYLPSFYDFFVHKQKAYIIMEFIEGATLGGPSFSGGRKRDEKLAIQITTSVLKGLQELHESGFCHNDLNPQNVMIYNDIPETVKVIDFGSGSKIETKDCIQLDLKKTARLCIYLLSGQSPKLLEGNELSNRELNAILARAFHTNPQQRYRSASEFLTALVL